MYGIIACADVTFQYLLNKLTIFFQAVRFRFRIFGLHCWRIRISRLFPLPKVTPAYSNLDYLCSL